MALRPSGSNHQSGKLMGSEANIIKCVLYQFIQPNDDSIILEESEGFLEVMQLDDNGFKGLTKMDIVFVGGDHTFK